MQGPSIHPALDSSGRRLRILVVDDNPDLADICGQILEIAGHDVRVAYSGEEAMAAGMAFAPGVALLDIGMPVMDGLKLAKAIRAAPWGRDVLLVAMTGSSQADDKRRSRQAGFDHHLVKPVDPSLLVARLQEWTLL